MYKQDRQYNRVKTRGTLAHIIKLGKFCILLRYTVSNLYSYCLLLKGSNKKTEKTILKINKFLLPPKYIHSSPYPWYRS